MFRATSLRRLPYPSHQLKPTAFPILPAVPASALPQTDMPTRGQKAVQIGGFVLALGV